MPPEAWHFQIEQNQAGNVRGAVFHGAQEVERLEPILGPDGVKSFDRQQRGQHLPRVGIVFDNKNVPRWADHIH